MMTGGNHVSFIPSALFFVVVWDDCQPLEAADVG